MQHRRYRRYAFRVMAIAFLVLTTFSATVSELPAKTATTQQTTKNCLWSIQTQTNHVYLLGSLHVLKQETYPLAAAIESAYADSQRIVFETDIGAMQDPSMQGKMLALGMYPQGQNLYQQISGNTRQQLEKKLNELGLPVEAFAQFKPWFVALTLTTVELQRLGFNPQYGIDVYFFNKAQNGGKEIGFLEAPEYQLDLLGNMTDRDQKDFLSQTLKDLEMVSELAGDLVKNWKTGNADELHKLLHKSFKDYPDLNDRLLIQRNLKWVQEIEHAMGKNKNVLFVVGAGHLVGPESVVDLLRKKGYEVKQK
ncbi:MAG: TraB/GumN family protein [Desulfobacterales bacterium]|nr:TraB/GumN family protein [Desulfobacterales bacterium]